MDYIEGQEIQGAGGDGCFPCHVPVLTPSGSVPIGTLQPGDLVVSFDDQGQFHHATVLAVHVHENHPVSRYHIWGGGALDITDNHWVLNQFNAFVAIGTLGPDDCLVDDRGHLRPILSRETLEPTTVYNLTVQQQHTFIAGGFRVHNAGLAGPITGAGGDGGGKGGGGASRTPVEAANNLFSVAFAKTVFLLSEGEVEGFPTSAERDILLDGTPIQRSDGNTYNFKDVTIEYKSGTDTQDPLKGFVQADNTISVGVEVSKDIGPVIRRVTDPDVEKVRVIIQHPALQSISPDKGDINATAVEYRISVSANGGAYSTKSTPKVEGKSSGQFQRAYEFELTGSAPWDIKVERLTADSTSTYLSNSIIWQAYTEIIDEKLSYPNSAVLGIKVDSRQFSSIPSVQVRLKGRRIQVPKNYDPTKRTYDGTWDGTWKTAWTDNPAWIFRDIVVNPIFGVKRYLSTADVDKWKLLEIAKYCDESVSNGKGGTEPRFRCNVYLQNEGSVFEVLNALASCFRGLIYYSQGKLFLSQDKPGTPVQQFTEANVIQETDDNGNITAPPFVYQGSSRTARKSVVIASWDDPDQNYNAVSEYLQDDELLRRYGYNPTDLRLLGVTSRGQALRAAKFALFANRYLTDKVTFKVGAEGLASGIGDIIQIADPVRQGQRLGGRIVSVSDKTITLDATLSLNSNTTYTVTVVVPDGETVTNGDSTTSVRPQLQERTVSSFSTDSSGRTTLTCSAAVSGVAGSIWVLEWTDMQARLYRILGLSEVEPMVFQIEALQYNASSYDYIDKDSVVTVPKDRFLIRDVDAPSNLSAKLDYKNGRTRIYATWTAPQVNGIDDPQIAEYRLEYRVKDSNAWQRIGDTLYTYGDVSLPSYTLGTTYEFRAASRNRLGQQSNWAQVTVDGFDAVADLSSSTYKAKLTHENLSDGRHKLKIDRGTAPVIERIKGYAVWVKPEAGVTIPGDTKPDKDGWYLLSDSVTLTGEYNIEFKALSTYDVRVNFTSNISGETFTKYITDKIERAEIAPPTPTNFTVILNSDNRTKRFSWQLPKSTYTTWKDNIVSDIKSYVLRYINTDLESATDAALLKAWDQAIALDSVSGTRTWFETTLFATSGENTILLRASDQTGWVSDKVVFITVHLVDKLTANVVNTVAWNLDASTNEYINCEVTDVADLRTETGADLLTEDSNVLQHTVTKYLKQVDPAQDAYVYWRLDNDYIKSQLTITTTATATTQHRIAALTGVEVALADESGNELQTEAGDSLNKTDLDYSAIEVSKLAASVFHPYSSGEELTEDIYGVQTLVRSTDGTTPGEISAVSYTLDYPDVLENFNDVSVVAAGTQIPLTKTFHTIKSVQVTIQDIGTEAVSAKVLAKTTTYVTVQVLNAAGTGVAGSVDVTVQGY